VSVTFPRCTRRPMKDGLQLNLDSPTIYIDLRDNKFQKEQSAISQSNSVVSPLNMKKKISSIKRTTNTKAKANDQKRYEIT